MTTVLTSKQQRDLTLILDAISPDEVEKGMVRFVQSIPLRKRGAVVDLLVAQLEALTVDDAQQQKRLLLLMSQIDAPKATETVIHYACNGELDDRVRRSALIAFSRLESAENKQSLLQSIYVDDVNNNRLNALTLRLLIGCHADDAELRKQYSDALLTMAEGGDADQRWAVLRALRSNEGLDALPDEVEERFVDELVVPLMRNAAEWRDVRLQAALVLGDVHTHLREAIVRLAEQYGNSADDTLRRYCISSMQKIAQRMDKAEQAASRFDEVMLSALRDDKPDIRIRAHEAMRAVLGDEMATQVVIDAVLQCDEPPIGYIEALRNINERQATTVLREQLFHLDPDRVERASSALTQLGGEMAFRTLYSQKRDAIEKYTTMLDETDEKIMVQYNLLMRQARMSFWISLLMHTVVFLLGVGLLSSVVYVAWQTAEPNVPIPTNEEFVPLLQGLLSGVGGVVAIMLGLFYKDPINQISRNVTRMVKVNVAFLGYMRQINQIDATFKQQFLDASGFSLTEMEQTVGQIRSVVDQSMERIQLYLDGRQIEAQ